ncbi:MAG: hypothetical protein A2W93_05295 [Bacteroidetes bacterium GWF2_43_63]|nr:MAG: hypothetical protein A2W94_11855 [Bacteroidetes bacterium GWE2_42_42]OFY56289.1 MAG: hypothetical protein A2W93_05295 [Bacteroidetes bacterium GWF2_43_63]
MTSDQYIIHFTGLAAGMHDFSWNVDGKFFEADNYLGVTDASVQVNCKLQKSDRLMELDFSGEGTITLPCDRCLGPLELKINASRKVIVKESELENSDNDDIFFVNRQDYEFSAENWIREMILLSLPMRNVHPEDKCDNEMIEKLDNLSDDSGLKPLNE